MKVKMKKLDLLYYHRDEDALIADLQEMGLLHIESQVVGDDVFTQALVEKIKLIQSILDKTPKGLSQKFDKDLEVILAEERDLRSQKEALIKENDDLKKELKSLEPWGEIPWQKIQLIKAVGWDFGFYIASTSQFKKLQTEEVIVEINRQAGNVYFLMIYQKEPNGFGFEQVRLSETSLKKVQRDYEHNLTKIVSLSESFENFGVYHEHLEKSLPDLIDQLNSTKVKRGIHGYGEGSLKHLHGWLPAHQQVKIEAFLNQKAVVFDVREARSEDQVPVLLKNNTYNRIFEQITNVYQLPKYRELDLTPFIGVFYPIFFAYCFGDAGYGLVLMLLSSWALFGPMKKTPTIGLLGLILGLATTIMGVVKSGTVFGLSIGDFNNIALFGWLEQFIFITDDQEFIFNAFNVSLMVGLFQILVGVVLSFYKKLRFQSFASAIPMFFKFFVIISSVCLFLGASQGMRLFEPLITISSYILGISIIGILVSHDLSQPFLKRVLSGFLEVFFVFTGILGDSLSYIRLFALGVSSSILGLVVNQIGAPLLEGGILSIIGGLLFLILGHGLNFAIAFLGALIHPLRLTFVEFYGNAQFEGGGKAFKTFSKTKMNLNTIEYGNEL